MVSAEQILHTAVAWYHSWTWVFYTFVTVLLTALLAWFLRYAIHASQRRFKATEKVWDDAVARALDGPLSALVWVLGLSVAGEIAAGQSRVSLLAHLMGPARMVAVVLVVTWFLWRATREIEANLVKRRQSGGLEMDITTIDALSKLVRASIFITAALVLMQTLGFSISGVLAFGGVGGIAVGFAAQGLLSNFLGGLTVYASKPFKVGEWILIQQQNLVGTVEHIGWRTTCLMGFDQRPIYIPNAMFNTAVVVNGSRMTNRRIMEYVQVRYRDIDKMPEITDAARNMVAEHPELEHDFVVVNFDSYGEFALKLLIYAFTRTTDYAEYMRIKEDVLVRVAGIVRDHDAELAVPASTVRFPEGLDVRSHGTEATKLVLGRGGEESTQSGTT